MLNSVWEKEKMKISMWGVMALMFLFCFISMYYADIWVTYHDSLVLLDCIADGRFLDFYEVKAMLYFIPVYIIFGIWNLPIWLMGRFIQIEYDNVWCLLWSKGVVLLFAVGCIWMIYCILQRLDYDNVEYIVFLCASSLLFVFPVMMVVQYDVIELFFLLYAINYYVKDEKLSWRSFLFFSVAISIKLFAIFIFLLFVLMVEKRIVYIIRDMFFGALFTIITMLPFWTRGYWGGASGHNIGFAYRLLEKRIPGGLASISIFLLGYLLLCAAAYFSKKKGVIDIFKYTMWLSAVCFMLIFTFTDSHPYWIVLYMPFLIIVIIEHKENLKVNVLIETVLEVTIILAQGMMYSWVYFTGGLFDALFLKPYDVETLRKANLVNFLGLSTGGKELCLIVANTVFFACEVVLLVINNPWKPVICDSTEKETLLTMKISRMARVIIIAALLALTVFIAF